MSDEEQTEGTPISVHDKDHPSLAATKEAQDVASLDRIIVPPGAYTDPSNPAAAAGSVNMSVYTHPADLPEDYGESVEPGEVDVRSVIDEGAADQAQAVVTGMGAGDKAADRPEDRDEWTKADWVAQASDYGLAKSGNMDTVKERVEDYEGSVEEAKDYTAGEWQQQIEDTDNPSELADLRDLYTASGASFSTVDSAFDDKAAALSGSDE
jgi:hypothetical protein